MKLLAPAVEAYFNVFTEADLKHLPEHDHHFTFLMLGGYALENLCKGFLVGCLSEAELKVLRDEGKLPEGLKNHRSGDYIENIGFKLNEIEEELVDRANAAVVWRGRYPIPTKFGQMNPTISMKSDVRRMFDLIDRIRHHVGAPSSYMG